MTRQLAREGRVACAECDRALRLRTDEHYYEVVAYERTRKNGNGRDKVRLHTGRVLCSDCVARIEEGVL